MRAMGLGLVVAVAIIAVLSADPAMRSADAAPSRPNVVIIITDDQRSGLSVMPETRRLFRTEGREFTNGMVTTPLCCPSRASIMTGLYAHNHGLLDNKPKPNHAANEWLHDQSLQAVLHRAGYTTALFGKYLNGVRMVEGVPLDDFDRHAVWMPKAKYNGSGWFIDGHRSDAAGYNTTLIERWATRFIRDRAGEDDPFLLVLAPHAAHAPFTPERRYADLPVAPRGGNPAVAEEDRTDKPPFVQRATFTAKDGERMRRRQFRTLASVDDMVASVFAELEATGEGDTMAFFISDNGYLWGEHGLAKKSLPYLPTIEVPFLMRWPDHIGGGSSDDRLIANIDITPTVLASLDIPSRLRDGRNLLDRSWDRDRLLIEYWGNTSGSRPWAGLVTKDRTYTQWYDLETGAVTFEELYDLDADPWQLGNMLRPGGGAAPSETSAASASDLAALLDTDRVCPRGFCP